MRYDKIKYVNMQKEWIIWGESLLGKLTGLERRYMPRPKPWISSSACRRCNLNAMHRVVINDCAPWTIPLPTLTGLASHLAKVSTVEGLLEGCVFAMSIILLMYVAVEIRFISYRKGILCPKHTNFYDYR